MITAREEPRSSLRHAVPKDSWRAIHQNIPPNPWLDECRNLPHPVILTVGHKRELRQLTARLCLEITDLGRQIRDVVSDLKPGTHPNIEIVDLGKEILISLTDEFDFGMFAIASARPTRELVTVMERIARVLQSTSGSVAVRGHTDGRPYRGVEYDNWRLSMARAQVATYMLVRGGLQEERVKRIEGHADRSLKVASDPLAAQNRRIEILVAKVAR